MRLTISVFVICSVVIQNAAVSQPRLEITPQVEILPEHSGEGSLVMLQCRPASSNVHPEPHVTRWYKVIDGEDQLFFQYDGTGDGQKQYPVNVPFTNVDGDESDGHEVALYNVTELTSGLYKCTQQLTAEVDSEHPLAVWRTRLVVHAPGGSFPIYQRVANFGLGSSVSLDCHLNVRFNRTYGYEWFKDNTKIYSYIPWNIEEPEEAFPVPNVSVNLQQSNGSHITLENLTTESLGKYKCVAHVNAPHTATHVERITLQTYNIQDD